MFTSTHPVIPILMQRRTETTTCLSLQRCDYSIFPFLSWWNFNLLTCSSDTLPLGYRRLVKARLSVQCILLQQFVLLTSCLHRLPFNNPWVTHQYTFKVRQAVVNRTKVCTLTQLCFEPHEVSNTVSSSCQSLKAVPKRQRWEEFWKKQGCCISVKQELGLSTEVLITKILPP